MKNAIRSICLKWKQKDFQHVMWKVQLKEKWLFDFVWWMRNTAGDKWHFVRVFVLWITHIRHHSALVSLQLYCCCLGIWVEAVIFANDICQFFYFQYQLLLAIDYPFTMWFCQVPTNHSYLKFRHVVAVNGCHIENFAEVK